MLAIIFRFEVKRDKPQIALGIHVREPEHGIVSTESIGKLVTKGSAPADREQLQDTVIKVQRC